MSRSQEMAAIERQGLVEVVARDTKPSIQQGTKRAEFSIVARPRRALKFLTAPHERGIKQRSYHVDE
jgi:hypothetical protein